MTRRRPAWEAALGRAARQTRKDFAPVLKGRSPRRVGRRRREASIEEACRVEAREEGWESRKMNGLGFRAWPDRLFLRPKRKPKHRRFWVEFKRPDEEPTPEQVRMHQELRERGETVYVCHTREEFRRALKKQSAG